MRLTILPIILSLFSTTAFAADSVTVNSVLENICIASDLSLKNIKQMIYLYKTNNNLNVKEASVETFQTLTNSTKAAWEIRDKNDNSFFITYTENQYIKNIIHGCVVTYESDDYAPIKEYIHQKYKISNSF